MISENVTVGKNCKDIHARALVLGIFLHVQDCLNAHLAFSK